MRDNNEAFWEFTSLIGDNLTDNVEGEKASSYNKIACETVLSSKTGIMADALHYWKKSGVSKREFISALEDLSAYSEAFSKFLKATAVLSEEIIPNPRERLTINKFDK